MYKVFVNEKPVIIGGDPETFTNLPGVREVLVHSRNALKEAYDDFIKSPDLAMLVLYNNGNTEKLLSDFISLFTYLEAAGGVVYNRKGERLFIFRLGKWDLPKGKIEKSETPPQAALREVSEETGLNGQTILCELTSTWHIYSHKEKEILKRTYWYAMDYAGNEQPVPQIEEEITKTAWFPESDIGVVMANTYAPLKELIKTDKRSEN